MGIIENKESLNKSLMHLIIKVSLDAFLILNIMDFLPNKVYNIYYRLRRDTNAQIFDIFHHDIHIYYLKY